MLSVASLLLCYSLIGPGAFGQQKIYVSPKGNDLWSGTSVATPLQTIARALEISRKVHRIPGDSIEILLLDGIYPISQTITLESRDSSLKILPLGGAHVTLTGGKKITGVWKRSSTNRWDIKVKEPFTQLFSEDRRLPVARYPNKDYWNPLEIDFPNRMLKFNHKIPKEFAEVKDAQLAVTGIWHWIRQSIFSFNPEDSTIITKTSIGPERSSAKVSSIDRAYFENAYAFLDTAGEWYLNPHTMVLTLISKTDPNKSVFYYPIQHVLISVAGTKLQPLRHVTMKKLNFRYTAQDTSIFERKGYQAGYWGGDHVGEPTFAPSASIMCRYVDDLTIDGCSFRHLGEGAIAFGKACNHSNIARNFFEDVGSTPIQVARISNFIGSPHPLHHDYRDSSNAPQYDDITENLIRSCASLDRGSVGICVGYANHILISHNTIEDMPYTGISVGWRWGNALVHTNTHHNIIEWNLVQRCMLYLSDGGGIYTCGQQPGSIIKNNWVREIGGGGLKKSAHGIYTDEGTGNFDIFNNYIQQVTGYKFFAHENIWSTVSFYNNNGTTGKNNLIPLRTDVKIINLSDQFPPSSQLYGTSLVH